MEKSFSGTSSGESDGHGTTKRVFQTFLTWMQEKKADVFIVATANDVQSLPPELMRAGRLDVTFWVDCPDEIQRQEILGIHLRKKNRDPDKILSNQNLTKELLNKMSGFTGAEIEQVVKNSLTLAFSHKHPDIQLEDLLDAVTTVTPVTRLRKDDIKKAREWAEERGALMASIEHKPTSIPVNGTKRKIHTS